MISEFNGGLNERSCKLVLKMGVSCEEGIIKDSVDVWSLKFVPAKYSRYFIDDAENLCFLSNEFNGDILFMYLIVESDVKKGFNRCFGKSIWGRFVSDESCVARNLAVGESGIKWMVICTI